MCMQDFAWLNLVNKQRGAAGKISYDLFELCMDRLEKQSHFLSQATGVPQLEVCVLADVSYRRLPLGAAHWGITTATGSPGLCCEWSLLCLPSS
jgi:hypothetical protein